MMGEGMQRQIGLMAALMAAQGTIDPGGKVPEEFLGQAIKEVVMHEVGHTLGLRHNFKSSTFISLKDANNPEITRKKGMTGSVMDYAPANFAPKGEKQGDYFSDTLGPYDYWAIEYAYKPTKDETTELAAIAAKSSGNDLIYATDEDTFLNPDPRVNLFDLGDPLEFAQFRVQLVKDSLDKLTEPRRRKRRRLAVRAADFLDAVGRARFGHVSQQPVHRRRVHGPRPPRGSRCQDPLRGDSLGQTARGDEDPERRNSLGPSVSILARAVETAGARAFPRGLFL